ncbi:MAG: NAD(P)H-dependent glycerol-3-phosphate dehydrogenase [Bacteroidota bacterium]|nr:NAD(P)H-dependent glycerol-3-phosphate dehydrogenase [Bacteroidota bacterium]
MSAPQNIAVIGGGSWATAIVKMLSENREHILWWMRNPDTITHIKKYGNNPNYISSADLHQDKLTISDNLDDIVGQADCLILAVPSAFLRTILKQMNGSLKDKFIVSAVKGIIAEKNRIIGEYLHNKFGISYENIGVLTGPCHAEEVALERLSYLTVACEDIQKAEWFAQQIRCRYIKANTSEDIFGTEIAAVLKNVIAIASGICHSLGYGDNFQSVLASNAIREIKRFVDAVHPIKRDIKESAYLGDLLVTMYSQFSRNRTFGNMIGKGYSVKSAQLEMKMVAEGFYAVKCIKEINDEHQIEMPITKAVYNILYERISPVIEMRLLSDQLN